MIHITQCVVVEGKYDKQKLSKLIDAAIIPTDGFRIFQDKEKRLLLRALAEKNGIIILTDSDRAGFLIRNHLKSFLPAETITNVYIPEILGKEKRKATPSKQGLLGVEGMPDEILFQAFQKAGVFSNRTETGKRKITKLDLYECGLSGRENSALLRQKLLKRLELPGQVSTNAFVQLLNAVTDYDEFQSMLHHIKKEKGGLSSKEGSE